MNKIVNFLIVVVLIARGAIYIYDNNKDKIDKFVAPVNTITTENSTNTNSSATPTDAKDTKEVSFATLTFLVTGDKEIYYYVGPFSGTLNAVNRDYVGVFIKAYKSNINPDDLMFIIKSDKNATFKNVIDLMDEMTKNEVPQGHYKEGDITQEETDKINLIKNSKNG